MYASCSVNGIEGPTECSRNADRLFVNVLEADHRKINEFRWKKKVTVSHSLITSFGSLLEGPALFFFEPCCLLAGAGMVPDKAVWNNRLNGSQLHLLEKLASYRSEKS